jgi:hypothetical protein
MDIHRKPIMRSVTLFIGAAALGVPLSTSAGNWQPLTNQPPVPEIFDPTNNNADLGPGGAAFAMLLTDGTVIIHNNGYYGADGKVFKLTPDINGSYLNGTWSEVATMPYVTDGFAQAMLPDGRVIIEGGEYSNYEYDFTLTNQGAIYDPVADTWTMVPPPPFFVDLYPPRDSFAPHPIGDSASVVLPNGTFMLADKMSRQAALLNLKNLTWKETGTSTKADMNDEEGWTLLPDGKVLTVDCYTDYYFGIVPGPYPSNPTHSEIYDPVTGEWSSAGSTINTLTDPVLSETGPAVLMPEGTVFAVGSQGYTSIYDSEFGIWRAGPRLPISPQGNQYTAQDAPGALLPSGNVLIAATGGPDDPNLGGYADPPVAFFEFDGRSFIAEPAIPNASIDTSSSINFLVLPSGQILETDSSDDVEIYTPGKAPYVPGWRPEVVQAPTTVKPGQTYKLSGIRLNGMSQGAMFGDEGQSPTNFPLLRITNNATKHVFYSRTHSFSSMAVASRAPVSMEFDVPAGQETGMSTLEVVANGVSSWPMSVYVQ